MPQLVAHVAGAAAADVVALHAHLRWGSPPALQEKRCAGACPGVAREALRWAIAPALHEKRCAGACPGATPVTACMDLRRAIAFRFWSQASDGAPEARHGETRGASTLCHWSGASSSQGDSGGLGLQRHWHVQRRTQEVVFPNFRLASTRKRTCSAATRIRHVRRSANRPVRQISFSRMSRAGQPQICHQRICSLSLLPALRSARPGNRTASMTRQALAPWHVTRWLTYLNSSRK